MNEVWLRKICDAGRLLPSIRISPRGRRFNEDSLVEEARKAVPGLDWRVNGTRYTWFVSADIEEENPDAKQYLDKLEAHFKGIDAWDDIDDPEFVDPEEDM